MEQMSLEARVGRLEDDPPIALEAVDLTVVDPAPLKRRFAEIFTYIATVEGAVPQNIADITTLLPDLGVLDRRFLVVWEGHELAHSAIFDALRAELGLPDRNEIDRPTPPTQPRRSFRAFGALAKVTWIQDVFKLVYLARGAMNEHMTYDCYRYLGHHFDSLGEHALARTVTEPIRRQEAAHLGYYRLAATTHRRTLSAAQVRLAGQITARTYAPVGSTPAGRDESGRVFTGLAGTHVDAVLDSVQDIADQLLGADTRPLPRFVHEAMAECLGRTGTGPGSTGSPAWN